MKAVHFGAGNIGRGFVGLLLHEGGYEVVFSDVAAALVETLADSDSYTVREVGVGGQDRTVTGFRAISSAEDPDAVAAEIAEADVVTTAVGPSILKFIAPHILAGLRVRAADADPLQVMACENAIGGTDTLRGHLVELAGDEWDGLGAKAVFANTAVDRIVPGQPADGGIDVTVEPFYEWAIESAPFGDRLPTIPGAHFVEDLGPYIERKLFTVNTGHATAAYLGRRAGHSMIAEALADTDVASGVAAALEETSALLSAKHGFTAEEMTEYRTTILERFRNSALPDTVDRVGRQPLRKLSRHERLIGPAGEAAERGLSVDGLLNAVGAALEFTGDEEAAQLHQLLERMRAGDVSAEAVTAEITGLDPLHPLFDRLRDVVASRV
ncbi:mannitol-1-phosphate 5-dehydrogenase [Nesterenkonia sp. NBAIMH1]|uniref:mannitol-1-phosphate 5-dehydrogenase n=1 Tax=Nesterenkonia sp. NBAIMH1 TaxID=2600320 RepID=UPI0011B5354D|nr:mannitol-1-phosphate 5-dehydrogenase [Nesterenkonia sp. NBAIMH1]